MQTMWISISVYKIAEEWKNEKSREKEGFSRKTKYRFLFHFIWYKHIVNILH